MPPPFMAIYRHLCTMYKEFNSKTRLQKNPFINKLRNISNSNQIPYVTILLPCSLYSMEEKQRQGFLLCLELDWT